MTMSYSSFSIRPLEYSTFSVRPLAGAGGAEVLGLNVRDGLGEATYADLRQALRDHLLLYFRDQELTDGHFEGFAEQFGPLQPHPFVKPIEGHPNMIAVERRPDDDKAIRIVGEDWHADAPWLERPVAGSLLYNLEAPPWGGDTQFCNLYLAYESLSDGLKETLDRLLLVHAAAGGANYLTSVKSSGSMKYDLAGEIDKEGEHPLIRTHPETGGKILGISGPYSVRFSGWTSEESRPLLDSLLRHATRAEHVFRVRWEPGTLAVWDNRCTLHQAIKDYQGFGRRMRRLQFAGERPVGPARQSAEELRLTA